MSNSYDNPRVQIYSLGSYNLGGTGSDAFAIPVPDGMSRCRIDDINAMCTETFTDGAAKVEIGTAGDANHYAELNIGTLADTNGLSMDRETEAFDNGQGGKGVVDIATEGITQLEVVLTEADTDGIAFINIVISWW